MSWPENTDYSEAIQNPMATLADPELKQGEVVANAMGMPIVRSGNFADVYEVRCQSGSSYAVKCFTREIRGLQQRYQSISDHLNQVKLAFTVEFQYQEKGILIKGGWFPILKMRWVEGLTLNRFVDEHADKPHILEQLAQMWIKLAQKLRTANMAHADLQHGNVLLVSGKTASSLGLRLIDYDGMFVPALANTRSGEVGHPNFQHPERIAHGIYNVEVDRFSHLVIYTALRCLAVGGRKLWQKYDNGETLLFREADLKSPGSSALFQELWQCGDPVVQPLAGRLLLACQSSFDAVPSLDDVVVKGRPVDLSPEQEDAVAQELSPRSVTLPSAPPPPVVAYGVKPPEITVQTTQLPDWLTPARERNRRSPSSRQSSSSSASGRDPPAQASLGGAIAFAIIGVLMVLGGLLIGNAISQATLVLAGLFVCFIAAGVCVDAGTGNRELGAQLAIGSTGLAWWIAGWCWLDNAIARLLVCLAGAFLFIVYLALCFRREMPRSTSPRPAGRALALKICGFAGVGVFLLTAVVALAIRDQAPPEPILAQYPQKKTAVPKVVSQPEVPPVNFPGGHRGLTAISISPDGQTVVTGGGGIIASWDVKKRRRLRQLRLSEEGVEVAKLNATPILPKRDVAFLMFSQDGREVLAGAGMTLALFSPDSDFLVHRTLPGDGEIVGGSFYDMIDAPKDRPAPFVYAHSSGTIIRWNWQDTAEGRGQVPSGLSKAAFTLDGHTALCVSSAMGQSTFHVWDVTNGFELGKPQLSGTQVALARDGRLAISNTLGLFSLEDFIQGRSSKIQPLPPLDVSVTAVALSPKGGRALATTTDGTLQLWDLTIRQEIMRLSIDLPKTPGLLRWHTLAFSSDGQHALWGSVDGALQWLTLPRGPQ